MRNPSLPDHADWRYKIDIVRFKGHASITLTDRESGNQVTHTDVQATGTDPRPHRVPEARLDAMVGDMVRFADSLRPPGDPIGEAARAAVAVARLRSVHADARDHLIHPTDYQSVAEHLADVAASLVELAALGVEMCETYEGYCLDVDETDGADLWRTAGHKLRNVRAGARGAAKAAASTARTVGEVLGHPFDCGDCTTGACHWGDQGGGRLATALRREAEGERCGCARHDVSVPLRTAAPRDLPPRVLAPAAQVADAARIVAAWHGRRVDPVGGLVGRVAAWAAGTGVVGVGELADDLDAVFTAGGPETLARLESHIGAPPVVLDRFDDDLAERILHGWHPHDPRHRLEPGAWFVNRHGRPLPRYAMADAPDALDAAQLAQFAREVYDQLRAQMGDVDTLGSIADVGAALFDVPGHDGPLLVPAGADLADVCIRLHVPVAAERETRPAVVAVDPATPSSGPPAAVLAKLAARGMVELTPPPVVEGAPADRSPVEVVQERMRERAGRERSVLEHAVEAFGSDTLRLNIPGVGDDQAPAADQ